MDRDSFENTVLELIDTHERLTRKRLRYMERCARWSVATSVIATLLGIVAVSVVIAA
jgi:hypothetical protein